MDKQPSMVRQFVVLFLATLAAFWVVMKLNVAGRIAYSVEKARIEAMREALPTPAEAADASSNARRLAAVVAPSVVSISTEREYELVRPSADERSLWRGLERFFAPGSPDLEDGDEPNGESDEETRPFTLPTGMGSGFIVDADEGHVLTNRHVVKDADVITVHLADGRSMEARLVASDERVDVALLQIEASNLIALPLGDSDETEVGDDVFAVGNAHGFGSSFSRGIVSAKNRSDVPLRGIRFQRFIQTDAVINPGNSGGPLVNMSGQVIGINTAIASPTGNFGGVGFAIPSSRVAQLLPLLANGQTARYGFLGVEMREIDNTERRPNALNWDRADGVIVVRVVQDGPADKAGIEAFDIIMTYDGQPVHTMDEVRELVGHTEPGTTVTIKVWRESKPVEVEVEIGTLPENY